MNFFLSKMSLFDPFNFATTPCLNSCREMHVFKIIQIKFQQVKLRFEFQLSKPKELHVIEY